MKSSSLHFQIVIVGTSLFLIALFWLTNIPHTNTWEERIAIVAPRIVVALQAMGCYIAFLAVMFAHKMMIPKKS